MSRYTNQYLNTMFLRGMTDTHGRAWWHSDRLQEQTHVGASGRTYIGTTYPGPIPINDVTDRFAEFRESFVGRRVACEVPAGPEDFTHIDDDGRMWRWAPQVNRKGMILESRDQAAGMFADGYEGHQYNEWLLKLSADVLGGGSLGLYSVGLLDGGNVAYAMFGIDGLTIGQEHGFGVLPHYLATTSFNGKVATTGKLCSTFVECDNTYSWAMGEGTPQFKRRHRKGSANIESARDALGLVMHYADDLAADMAVLASIPVSAAQWSRVVEDLAPYDASKGKANQTLADAKREQLHHLWSGADETSPYNPTALGAMQTVSTWHQWHRKANEGTNRAERNMLDTVTGRMTDADAKTFSVLVATLDLDVDGLLARRDRLVAV